MYTETNHADDGGPTQAPEARPKQDRFREALLRRRLGAGGDRAGARAPGGRRAHPPAPAAAQGNPQGRRAPMAVSVGRKILLDTNWAACSAMRRTLFRRLTGIDLTRCPRCRRGSMVATPRPPRAPFMR